MSSELVTVATFNDPVEAAMARNYLEAAGIAAFLLDEETVATNWAFANAIGGIKLQVSAANAERAEAMLDDLPGEEYDTRDPVPSTAFATAETAEELRDEQRDDEEMLDPKNDAVDRLLRCTIAGLIILPVQFYALLLLMSLSGMPGSISPDRRWKVWVSVVLNLPLWGLVVLPLLCMIGLLSGPGRSR